MFTLPFAGVVNLNHTSSSLSVLHEGSGDDRVADAVVKNWGEMHFEPPSLMVSWVAVIASLLGVIGLMSCTLNEKLRDVKLSWDQKRR